ncbi:hypothetical protein NDU88_007707 [Pleurodeles waltl]|uniref:Uncharacterized protein n=1 Tax=Pleurodeles waltl TaxID=8319 RepID=A0AAV7RVW0_PLEWA|nr:hypothetical protein NDU88_007707 [Pleurodeles waltl]
MFDSLRLWQTEGRQRRIKAAKDAKRHAAKSDAEKVQEYDRQNVEQGWAQIDRRHQLDTDRVYVAHPPRTKKTRAQEGSPYAGHAGPPAYIYPYYVSCPADDTAPR